MSAIPCIKNKKLSAKIDEYAEELKVNAHIIGTHGLNEQEFYQSGIFRGAIERIRGQFSASMSEKRDFVKLILNHLQDESYIDDWESTGGVNRHDYSVRLKSGKIVAIELKGCLDGNNTNIFERPVSAQEFIVWSICTNPGADPQHNVWSGIHTRLSAEIISRQQLVDGLIVWDWFCNGLARPCPKIENINDIIEIGPHKLPPPCLYLFPQTVPSVRNNPAPETHKLQNVEFLKIMYDAFGCRDNSLNKVSFVASNSGADIVRRTEITREGVVQKFSAQTPIKRN